MTREQFIYHVEATQKAFRRFLVALCCGDTALADDVAQESYIKAYLSCDSFSNLEKLNDLLSAMRMQKRLPHMTGPIHLLLIKTSMRLWIKYRRRSVLLFCYSICRVTQLKRLPRYRKPHKML